jgi:hypothetical protein
MLRITSDEWTPSDIACPAEIMDAVIEEDLKHFAGAMTRAGLDPVLKFNGVEMINALSKRYEDDVDGTLAAAELGLTEFSKAANDSDKRLKPMLRRLEQSLVPRDQFETAFKALAKDITDDSPLEVAILNDKDFTAKPAHRGGLSITSDRNSYQRGDTPIFQIPGPSRLKRLICPPIRAPAHPSRSRRSRTYRP